MKEQTKEGNSPCNEEEHAFFYRGRDDMFAILVCNKCGETKCIDIMDWLEEEEHQRKLDDEYSEDYCNEFEDEEESFY